MKLKAIVAAVIVTWQVNSLQLVPCPPNNQPDVATGMCVSPVTFLRSMGFANSKLAEYFVSKLPKSGKAYTVSEVKYYTEKNK